MHHDHYAAVDVFELTRKYKINNAIETGTYVGDGTLWLLKIVDNVTTIELDVDYFIQSQLKFRMAGFQVHNYGVIEGFVYIYYKKPNTKKAIISYLGNSPDVLNCIFKKSDKRVYNQKFFVYLDAHWGDQWPILNELRALAKYKLKKCLIAIHDFKVPGKKWSYDKFKKKPLDKKYVKKDIMKINPDYTLRYNKKSLEGKSGRGILYAIPTNLDKK